MAQQMKEKKKKKVICRACEPNQITFCAKNSGNEVSDSRRPIQRGLRVTPGALQSLTGSWRIPPYGETWQTWRCFYTTLGVTDNSTKFRRGLPSIAIRGYSPRPRERL